MAKLLPKFNTTFLRCMVRLPAEENLIDSSNCEFTEFLTWLPSDFRARKTFAPDDVMSDVNFQSNNIRNIFLVITKTTEFVKRRHFVSSSLYRQLESSAGNALMSLQSNWLKVCTEARKRHTQHSQWMSQWLWLWQSVLSIRNIFGFIRSVGDILLCKFTWILSFMIITYSSLVFSHNQLNRWSDHINWPVHCSQYR